jgi:hypothetical protein
MATTCAAKPGRDAKDPEGVSDFSSTLSGLSPTSGPVRRRTGPRSVAPEGACGFQPLRAFRRTVFRPPRVSLPTPRDPAQTHPSYEAGAPFPVHPTSHRPSFPTFSSSGSRSPTSPPSLGFLRPTDCVSTPVRRRRSPIVSSRLPPRRLARFQVCRQLRRLQASRRSDSARPPPDKPPTNLPEGLLPGGFSV